MKAKLSRLCALSLLALLPVANAAAGSSAPAVALKDFKLAGTLSGDRAAFTLNATARVESSKGGTLELLAGPVALTDIGKHKKWRVRAEQNRFLLTFDRRGEFPIQIKFDAAVRQKDGWNAVDFRVAPGAVQPIVLSGLAADTEFRFAGAARPERSGKDFVSYLPADGSVSFSWREARPEVEGRLFYSAEMLSQISVSPGLMRQVAVLDCKVMQGELNRVALLLRGAGEVTRVQGDQVLAWNVEPVAHSSDRRLVIRFNQAQKDQFAFQVQLQTPLGAFPQTAEAVQLRPENATRFAGCFRIVNEGAVRLEVVQAAGMSQISPEQFPETDATRAAFRPGGNQRFAYRFSGADFALRIQADQILPELAVSQVLVYHHGENELSLDAEIELDIREAPLRELLLRVPRGYAVARLNASGVNDYFLQEKPGEPDAELRLIYGQPVSGRQLVQLRLERNQNAGDAAWALPRLEVSKARSVRGFVGVSADAGFRMTPEKTQALTEIATAFFPKKLAGIQAAFRLNDPTWQATLQVERLPQTVQADVLHLFSIGEGIAYGSSVMNFVVSGAPKAGFRIELSDEYANVEFTGRDLRNWHKTEGGYLVQLHTPVSGTYTLLATYERPFKSQGETLAFTGARPLDAQSEQGYTLVISAYQFQVQPTEISPGLLPLEPGEVPNEYRLFFDAPVLAAYRYAARPFTLKLALSPLEQGKSLNQIVDRGLLTTRIVNEGQVLTEVHYFIKNRGYPHFRLTLAEGTRLWAASVNGAPVVPVTDGKDNLIPIPQSADPNAIAELELSLAAHSSDPRRVNITAPVAHAPVMLAEWTLQPDAGQRLTYRKGSLVPVGGVPDRSGFAQLARLFEGARSDRAWFLLLVALGMVGATLVAWRWAMSPGVHRFSARHLGGLFIGLVAFTVVIVTFAQLSELAAQHRRLPQTELTFLAPVQQAGSALNVEVLNVKDETTWIGILGCAWPALLGILVWGYGWLTEQQGLRRLTGILGWTLIVWAALRFPNGAGAFFWVVLAFLLFHMVIPALRELWKVRPKPQPAPEATENGSVASVITAWLLGGLVGLSLGIPGAARGAEVPPAPARVVTESVIHTVRVEDKYAIGSARISWQAKEGQVLPLLFEPAVLTHVEYPTRSLKLVPAAAGARWTQELVAQKDGLLEFEVQYQLQFTKEPSVSRFALPLPYGLINQVKITVAGLDVEIVSPEAVSVQTDHAGTNTVASVLLSPADTWIGWKPRSRDVKREKAVFYADVTQLYAPSAGVIEGAHFVSIRPAQGELGELTVNAPPGATITDVAESSSRREEAPSSQSAIGPARREQSAIVWRFDPDTRKLRITLSPAQSRPFSFVIRSQIAAGPLPFEHTVGLISVDQAAGQIGLLGVATGNEVQLDGAGGQALSPINLEDFPADASTALRSALPGLVLRRAFRYSDTAATASLKASPVEPDVRVESQDTLSIGDDRTVLAANVAAEITRAGIFRLSFVLPAGFEVETISGQALSHWTELKTGSGRVITLHLTGKTEGKQQFAVNLAGPGVKATNGWAVPQLVLREASKQRGSLLIVPEQGMRLQVAEREGMTQLDPQKSGIRQKGVLAFRVLQTPSRLVLDVEQVDPWVQVTSLQHARITEAQVKVHANLQYQIENTGLKTFRVFVPANAEGVRFQGEQVADFLAVAGSETNHLQEWEVKLHRRVIGPYLLQVTYQTLVPSQAAETLVRGVEAAGVNLQRGFVTVQSDARLQVTVDALPGALQPTEWQSIPRALQQDLQAAAANFAYRLVEPSFELPLKLQRHEAAKLLAARVKSVNFNSVISDNGEMLTRATLELEPGDKRLLKLTLPKGARFWFAFVSDSGVWPWRDQDQILVPLEQPSRGGQPVPVDIFYSCEVASPGSRSLDFELLAPQFDLPLEDITWRVSLSDKWEVKHWAGSLQLREQETVAESAVDLGTYLQAETAARMVRTKEAEELMAMGNSALAQGDPQQARRAFEAAYGLSTHDAAFNEDARVQLHNVKLQQALVGLNARQSAAAGDAGALGGKFRDLRSRKDLSYTQQDAKEIIDRNTADENAAFMRLAERLIQQQDAAVSSPAVIRTTIPEQTRVLTFHRAVLVDPWRDLTLHLKAVAAKAASPFRRLLILGGTFLLLGCLAWAARLARLQSKQA